MKLDIQLFQVLPDELHHSRKWVCEIIPDDNNIHKYRSERSVSNDDTRHDDLAKKLVMDDVFESFIQNYIGEMI